MSCIVSSMSKSVARVPNVSTSIVRVTAEGSSMWIWSWKLVIVPTIACARLSESVT
jgi:hypothetical protein